MLYNQAMNRKVRYLCYYHFFVGVGALLGGMGGMLNPYDPLGIPIELLEGSPFSSYFIPSLILFTVIGLGHTFSGWTALKNSHDQGYISSVFSWALMIWIVVQCIMLEMVTFLHVLYFLLGLIGTVLAMLVLFEKRQFPTNLIKKR